MVFNWSGFLKIASEKLRPPPPPPPTGNCSKYVQKDISEAKGFYLHSFWVDSQSCGAIIKMEKSVRPSVHMQQPENRWANFLRT
jgi:hypothetical protein